MSFLTGFLLGRVVAERQGITDDATINKLALMGAVMGGTPTGLMMTTVLAQREAEAVKLPAAPVGSTIQVEVPDVTDETFNEAKKRLESLGLVINKQDLYSLTTSKGHVISQNPQSGAIVPQSSTVALAVSLGADAPSHCPNPKNQLVGAGSEKK